MITAKEQTLIKAKIRRWRNISSGWLVITSGQLEVYRSRLIQGPEKVENFEISRLRDIEHDAVGKSFRLWFQGPEEETTEEVFFFKDKKHGEEANNILVELLKEEEEEKKRKEEEAANLEKERLEQEKKIREAYASEIWEISEALWLIAKASYSMVNAVIKADWSEVRRQYSALWQQVDRLGEIHKIELMASLKELDEEVTSSSGQEVIKKSGQFLKQLSDEILRTETIRDKWQEYKTILATMSPNCDHLPYFLLFGSSHFEALLSVCIEDWTGVNSVLSSLQSSGTVLRSCFYIELDRLLDAIHSAAMERNVDLFTENALQVEKAVSASFKTKVFKLDNN